MKTFEELGLSPEIIKSLSDLGFVTPSSIQEKAIPFILGSKNDLIALAQTGTGKTAAFGLPIIDQVKTKDRGLKALILCPTRELCIQISRDMESFAKHSKGIKITPVYGGERIDIQMRAVRSGTDIVVGTPGRVHDLIRRKVLDLQSIKWLVLDEADEMLDMGFKEDLDAILEQTPKTRQTLLFSATISKSVHSIAKRYMHDAKEISIGEKNVGAEKVTHEYYVVQARDRFESLKRILDNLPGVYGIIFCRTRIETQEVSEKLKQARYDAESLHGDIAQNVRTKIMDRFKKKHVRLLVATDVAARGIDVNNLSHVINYNLPDQNEAYTHRSGRTGRASNSGISISIVGPREVRVVKDLERMIGKTFEYKKIPSGDDICRKQIDNFIKGIEEADIKEITNDGYFSEIAEKLKKINKDDLIKYFISHELKHLMEAYKNAPDLNADARGTDRARVSGDGVNLKINLGKKCGFDVKGLFSLVNSNDHLKGVNIGRIELMPAYSIFSVESDQADKVIKNLSGSRFRGLKVEVSKSNERPSFGDKRGAYQGARGPRKSSKFRGGFRAKKRW